MNQNFTQFAFTNTVKDFQEANGSRESYARAENSGDRYRLTDQERYFINKSDSFYISTVGENGWPYVQYKGGPKGFLKIIDDQTLGYADYSGNRQYISDGNIQATQKATLFLMDYANKQRLKIWTEASIHPLDENSDLHALLVDSNYPSRIERYLKLSIQAFDWNCPQHITQRFTIGEIELLYHSGQLGKLLGLE